VSELKKAETVLIQYLQHQYFPMPFSEVEGKFKPKVMPRSLKKLQLKFINGLVRVGGRLSQVPFDFDLKHPTILPQRSHFMNLLIQQHYAEVDHSGSRLTWTSLHRRYWIVKGGVAVRKCIGKCIFLQEKKFFCEETIDGRPSFLPITI